MLLLSPKIQEEIISLENEKLASISEYKLRRIIDEVDWDKQYPIWQELFKNAAIQ